jgi:murein DD-endopeptidase MepM/ murein hydrolase activator NlpD
MTHAHSRSTHGRVRLIAAAAAVIAGLTAGASHAAAQVEMPGQPADRVGSAPAPTPAPVPAAPVTAPRAAAPATVAVRLRIGSRGPTVRALQRALRQRGFRNVRVDGAYGPGTRAAVRALQRRMKLRPTGVADAALLKRLRIVTRAVASSGLTAPSGTVVRPPSAHGFIWPVRGNLSSPYGWRWGRMHQGIDLATRTGTPIAAAAAGTVTVAGWRGAYGQMVVIDHGDGVSTAYAHQSAIGVTVGQAVQQGTIIGAVGSTGRSTGPHLHFEVRINGSATDPLPYL